jgi:glycosyltransferase involved in cell wall biosynthesis
VDPSIRNPRATRALWRYLRATRPSVVHSSIGEANFHAALVSKLSGVPVTIIEEQGLPARGTPARLVHTCLYRLVDCIVGVSSTSCGYVLDKEFAPRERVRLIYNCARPEFFAPHERQAKASPFTLLAVGRLVEVKNHFRLLEAFANVVKKHPSARLRIVGDGPLAAQMASKVSELRLEPNVELMGYRNDVMDLLLAADAFVLCSLSEGCSLALAEAMALATPVLGSDAGGIPEVMREVGAEWLVPPTDVAAWTDAIVRMLELPFEQREKLGQLAQAAAQRFAPSHHTDSIQAMYDELLARA